MNSKINKFNIGDKFEATIKSVRDEGVYIYMGKSGSGTISPACWGNGEERAKALAMLKPGDRVPVVVKSYNKANRSLSLLLDGGKLSLGPSHDGKWKKSEQDKHRHANAPKSAQPPAKPAYKPIPAGSTLLIDVANLLGAIGPVDAARNLAIVGQELELRGFSVAFFLERRAWGWCMYNQVSNKQGCAWRDFSRDPRLSLVDGESDLAMLQVANAVPNAFICTRDRLSDYSGTYSEIVSDRRRSFSVVNLGGRMLIAIDGLVDAVAIDPPVAEVECEAGPVREEEPASAETETAAKSETEAECSFPDSFAKHARIADPVRYFGRLAEKDADAYYALADHYSGKSARKERKYLRLAAVAEKRCRETLRRDVRRFKAAKRGTILAGHFSRQRRNAVGIAEFARVHNDLACRIVDHRLHCGRSNRRAA